jgi:thiamine-phosphate pyrophosphorylase
MRRSAEKFGELRKLRRQAPIICYVTDRRSLPCAPADQLAMLLSRVEAIAEAGADWVQIREKDLSGRAAAALVREALRRVAKQPSSSNAPPRVLVNDRLDTALAEGAGGVHFGENGLPVSEVKDLLARLRPDTAAEAQALLIGVSTHSLEAAKAAAASGASYIFFGPVFATPSKVAFGAPQGLARLAEICAAVDIPVLAIGGITLENTGACFEAGAAGIAAIRLFQDAADPSTVIRELRKRWR